MAIENSVSIEAGSTSVVGYVTQFVAAEGDLLIVNGITAVIAAVASTSSLTLAKPWPGPAVVDEVDWDILTIGPYWRSTVTTNTLVTELLRKIDGGLPLKPDAAGTLAERASYDGQGEGFLFLRTDVDPFLLYVKTGPDAADWSEGQRLQGDQAASTLEAIAAADAAQQDAQATAADRQAVETATQAVEDDRQAVDTAAAAVESARQEVATNTAAVADDAQAVDLAAAAVESSRQEVADNTATVAADAQAVEMARQQVVDNAATVAADRQAVDTAAAAVEAGRQEVATNLATFQNVYYGPLASDPLTRPDGSAIQEGDTYTRITNAPLGPKVHSGGAWIASSTDPAALNAKLDKNSADDLTFTAESKGVRLSGGGRLFDQNSGGSGGVGRTAILANNDSFEILTEDGLNSLFAARFADTAPTFKGQPIFHGGNLPAPRYDVAQTLSAAQIEQHAANAKQAFTLLRSRSFTTGVTVEDISLDAGFEAFKLVLVGMEPAAAGDSLYLRFSFDGTTFAAAAGDYTYEGRIQRAGAPAADYSSGTSNPTGIILSGGMVTGGGGSIWEINIPMPRAGGGSWTHVNFQGNYMLTGGDTDSIFGGGRCKAAATRPQKVRLYSSSGGNIALGRWALYGMRF